MSIEINKNKLLTYLGYKGQEIDDKLYDLIDQVILEVKDLSQPRKSYRKYRIDKDIKFQKIIFEGSNISLRSSDFFNLLNNSEEVIVMGVSLGITIDRKINLYKKTSLNKSIIMDFASSVYIEEIMEKFYKTIENSLDKGYLTRRFSPGYGDLSLKSQGKILELIDGSRDLGITLSSHNILLPRKSITALAGVTLDKLEESYPCSYCNKKDCVYNKDDQNEF